MEWWQLLIYGPAVLIMSVLSGIAGAGGGFIITPLSIFLGLTPAQAVASGKFSGVAVTLGSLSGLRGHNLKLRKGRIVAIMILAFLIGLSVPFVIKYLDSDLYRVLLGAMILAMVPIVVIKKIGIKAVKPSAGKAGIGGILLAISLFLQGAFSGGLGTLVNIVLMGFMGMTATEANVTKRWSQLILNLTIIAGVIGSQFIIWNVVIVGVVCALIGSYVGGRLAIKRGNSFVMKIMISLMIVSGVALIASAL